MLRVPWITRRTNERHFNAPDDHHTKNITRHHGHTLRGTSFKKYCLLGVLEGTRDSGKQIFKYMDVVKTFVGCRTTGEVVSLA